MSWRPFVPSERKNHQGFTGLGEDAYVGQHPADLNAGNRLASGVDDAALDLGK